MLYHFVLMFVPILMSPQGQADLRDAMTVAFQVQAPNSEKPAPTPAPMVAPVPDVEPIEKSVVKEPAKENRPQNVSDSLDLYETPKVYGNHLKRGVLPDDLPDGLYLLKVVGGVKTLEVAEEVSLNDPLPPGPAPGNLSDRAKVIKMWADKVTDPKRAETAQGLAAIYREIAANAKAPATAESVGNAALTMTTIITDHQGSTTAWAPVREALRAQIAEAIQKGNNGNPVTVDQMAQLLKEAADGLEASAPKQAGAEVYKTPAGNSVFGVSPEFWKFLMDLFMKLLPILLGL